MACPRFAAVAVFIRFRRFLLQRALPAYFGGALFLGVGCLNKAPNIESGMRVTAAGTASEPMIPPHEVSGEARLEQLQLAREQGKAVEQALNYLLNAADSGGKMRAGEYEVAYLIGSPERWHIVENGAGSWHSAEGNMHLSVVVRDGYDGRLVPELTIDASLLDNTGNRVAQTRLQPGWYPLVHRYGENISAPSAGEYQLRIDIEPARFARHDPVNGDRFKEPVSAIFQRVIFDPAALTSLVEKESNQTALSLAIAQGNRLQALLDTMISGEATDGAETRAGDYLVAYAVEYAEGLWHLEGDKLRYDTRVEASAELNAHVEVAVRDAATGRLIAGVPVTAELYLNDEFIGREAQRLLWHPWLYHYGANWRVPRSGSYRLHVQAGPSPYRVFGRDLDARLSAPVEVVFENVNIKTGQK